MTHPSRIVVFEQISTVHAVLAVVFRLLGFKVMFIRPVGKVKDEFFIQILLKIGIEPVFFGRFEGYDISKHYIGDTNYGSDLFKRIFPDEDDVSLYAPIFYDIEDFSKRIKPVALNLLVNRLGRFRDIDYALKYYCRLYKKVYVCIRPNEYLRMAMAMYHPDVGNLYPGIVSLLETLAYHGKRGYRWLRRSSAKMLRAILRIPKRPRTQHPDADAPDYAKFEILYFPHKGVAAGALFLRDQYYSDNPESPFYDQKILHIEYSRGGLGRRDIKKMISFYETRKIPYCIIKKARINGLKFKYLRFLISRRGVVKLFKGAFGAQNRLMWLIYEPFSGYRGFLEAFSSAKLALIGYDILCPKPLLLALASMKIHTVATQDRFVVPFLKMHEVLVDDYFVAGEAVRKCLLSMDTSYVKSITIIGLVKLDLIHHYKYETPYLQYDEIKRRCKIAVVYDIPTRTDRVDLMLEPTCNARNQREFLKDIIKLAIEIPGLYVVIRGKNDNWCNMEEFQDLYEMIGNLKNIEVNRNYNEFNVSYKLAAVADVVIVNKYTSIGDECLAAGIPVLYHDYTRSLPYGMGMSLLFDYEGLPVYVSCYEDMKTRVLKIINGSGYMDPAAFASMRQRYYHSAFDGKIRERLQTELHRILRQSSTAVTTTDLSLPIPPDERMAN
jgi:hypothetical protein